MRLRENIILKSFQKADVVLLLSVIILSIVAASVELISVVLIAPYIISVTAGENAVIKTIEEKLQIDISNIENAGVYFLISVLISYGTRFVSLIYQNKMMARIAFKSSVSHTFVNGILNYHNGEILGPNSGQRLVFMRK